MVRHHETNDVTGVPMVRMWKVAFDNGFTYCYNRVLSRLEQKGAYSTKGVVLNCDQPYTVIFCPNFYSDLEIGQHKLGKNLLDKIFQKMLRLKVF